MTSNADLRGKTALFIEDHGLVRASFAALLQALAPEVALRTVNSLAEAVDMLAERADDFVFVDLSLRDASGLTALLTVRQHAPNSALVVVSGMDSPERVRECARAGAKGFLPKSLAVEELTAALSCLLRDGRWFPPTAALDDPCQNYSPRCIEILSLVAQGMTDKQIGRQLRLSSTTVKWYVRETGAKLGARKRTAMVALARERGLI